MRTAVVERKTGETKVLVSLNVDGGGSAQVNTGVGFLDHMLTLFAKHGLFDLKVEATGDLQADNHHVIEDVAIVLGTAFRQALGDKKGINRYGYISLPMDETFASVAVDLSGRSYCVFSAAFTRESVNDFPTEMAEHFFDSFSRACECNLHAKVEYGRNDHHKIEALFKALSRALKAACELDERAQGVVQSTKGVL
ncbi:imidazoleglycerol-phosphate dehydratase HisB [Candidatus Micrarchaeota archaeon]|nr:imidazoleglycerol-phosphate dehydratase HisB [Candidatus Micrarchaeota archaeon]